MGFLVPKKWRPKYGPHSEEEKCRGKVYVENRARVSALFGCFERRCSAYSPEGLSSFGPCVTVAALLAEVFDYQIIAVYNISGASCILV